MKLKNVFLLWLWANLMIGFWAGIFAISQDNSSSEGIGVYFTVLGIGFLFTLPSLAVLLIFQYYYSKNSSTNNYVPYVLVIVLINLLYFITYYLSSYNLEFRWIAFFLLTTFCGLVALFIEYNKVKKSVPNIEIEQFPNDEIQ